ncbi:hypothetical protein PPYR_04017 [Photinus pyralis]|nr:uncharacterized protein LOC116163227 isoform X2 [Photinus pyralis]XP_031332948.1 uncharacterized protein LOC116163227 isoform X2 [Photinus pyralis]XP_031332949.1 uncharacterized protein LOC116163227 isoform X2 [Photinus pyralis]XP_031332950.1 uncharacterized protein LOC116163227 isoform X2 [Photinus pyralis]KAB0801831.1 hypothetical protein PPYR_04017 [Photinus pyralis]
MVRVNRGLLPIKAHFLFFMAAMGPILPQLSVYGRELGISPVVMGTVTGILPILFLLSKPAFGLLVDVLRHYRKAIFLGLILATSLFYALLYFVPSRFISQYHFKKIQCSQPETCKLDNLEDLSCNSTSRVTCDLKCNKDTFKGISGIIQLGLQDNVCFYNASLDCSVCDAICDDDIENNTHCLYTSFTFWAFIILISLGTIGFNVLNSISDAICFDVIEDEYDYGKQRVWGTIGFGITALISGYVVQYFSGNQLTYTPALIIMLICTAIDFFACIKLEIPIIQAPKNIFKSLKDLLNNCQTIVFIFYATMAGIVDSFVVYFLFWYIEDFALLTKTPNTKLLEGLIVAAQTLGAEIIFFYISGTIIRKIGYAATFSCCFLSYGIRYGLISIVPSPWWIIPIEALMQGPSYALIYTTIVAYANAISPPGMSATMQGIAAGMDDGFGYAVGSVLGGILYKYIGGTSTLRVFSGLSIVCGISYLIIHKTILRNTEDPTAVKVQTYHAPGNNEDLVA